MEPTSSNNKPKTRHQLRMKKKAKKDRRREKNLFKERKVIGPNDTFVDTSLGKIKLERMADSDNVVVKYEEIEENLQEEMDVPLQQHSVLEGQGTSFVAREAPEEQNVEDVEENGGDFNIEVGPVSLVKQESFEMETQDDDEIETGTTTASESDAPFYPHIVSLTSLVNFAAEPNLPDLVVEDGEEDVRVEKDEEKEEDKKNEDDDELEIVFEGAPIAQTLDLNADNVPPKKPKLTDDVSTTRMHAGVKDNSIPSASNEDWLEELLVGSPHDNIYDPTTEINEEIPQGNAHIHGTNVNGRKDASECSRLKVMEKSKDRCHDTVGRGCSSKNEETHITFESASCFEEFMEHENNSDINHGPFKKTSSVTVKIPLIINSQDKDLIHFWDCANKLFSAHGSLIRNLTLDIVGAFPATKVYVWIKKILVQTSNLCHLTIKYNPDDANVRVFSITGCLPPLRQLESLQLGSSKLPMVMSYVFLEKYSKNLRKLEIPLEAWTEDVAASLEKLIELHLTQVTAEAAPDLHPCLKSLQKNATVRNQLTTLTISLEIPIVAHELCKMLEPFQGLTELKLILLDSLRNNGVALRVEMAKSCPTGTPSLNNIRSLTISMSSSQRCFEFIKWFPSLESLQLYQVAPSNYGLIRDETVSDIDLELRRCLARNSAVKSRIWRLLPTMKKITVQWASGFGTVREQSLFQRELCQ